MPDGSVSQRNRLGKFHSPLGPDALALVRFSGHEGVNQLGASKIDVLSPGGAVDLDALLGLHGTVEIQSLQHGARFFDGIITEAEITEERQDGWLISLVLRPWFWLAGLRRNQRIFHNKTAPQIIAEVLDGYAYTKTPRLMRAHKPIEYTVQYGESDLAFICRMMERHGISYHFEHKQAEHAMVLTDTMEGFKAAPGGTREFQPVKDQHRSTEEHFSVWSLARRITTGRVKLTDYNFKTPTAAMPVDVAGDAVHAEGVIESFDYPGIYLAQDTGRGVARVRMDQERGGDGLFMAQGDTASLSPGMLVGLTNHPEAGLNGKNYLLKDAVLSYVAEAYASGAAAADEGDSFAGRYTFHPQAKPFQPPMVTAPARIYGPQTAVVVGEGEIDCDEYGRILVRFHWDLAGAHSMRCRVAQIWAGNGWGGMVIPRIGMEVMVEFLEGDPDKPLVTGCVYNGKNKVPYPLPEHKTKSVFRTDTHQGTGFNELTFEDAAGAENISLHAQKDQTLKVLHNRSKRVDNDQVESIGNNKAISIGKNHQENIGGSMNLSVGSSGFGQFAALGGIAAAGGMDALAGSEAVGSKAVSAFVGGLAAVGAAVEAVTGKAAGGFAGAGNFLKVAGAEQMSAGAKLGSLLSSTMPMSGVMNTVVEKFVSDTIGIARTEQIGAYKNTSVGHTMTVHVGKEFIINVGKSKFVMDSDGNVTIIGTKFNFTASGNVQINGKVIDLN